MQINQVISVPSDTHPHGRNYVRDVTTPLEGVGLVTPTRLMFESGELQMVTYRMKDGRIVTYEDVTPAEEDDALDQAVS